MPWQQKETDEQRVLRTVNEIGEVVRAECIHLARRHNGWLLNALQTGEKSVGQLYWRQPPNWGRDLESELAWMEELELVCHYINEEWKEVWRAY